MANPSKNSLQAPISLGKINVPISDDESAELTGIVVGASNTQENQKSINVQEKTERLYAAHNSKMGFFQRVSERLKGNLISIQGDGLCLFRAALVESKKSPIYAKMNKEEVKNLALLEFGELIELCVEEQLKIFCPEVFNRYADKENFIKKFTLDNIETMYDGKYWAEVFCSDRRLNLEVTDDIIGEMTLFAEGMTNLIQANLNLKCLVRNESGNHFDVMKNW